MKQDETLFIRAYLILEAVLFVAIKAAEFLCPLQITKLIMFSAILLNTLVTFRLYRTFGRYAVNQWDNLIALSLGVNCVADVFLTLIGGERMFVPGFASFCAVELIYAVYLRPGRANLAVRGALFALVPVLAWRLNLFTFANLLGAWNLSLLAVNVVSAWRARAVESTTPARLFAAGLTFFLAGDTSVAVRLLTPPGTIHTAAALLVWVFYIPAEVLLVLTYFHRVRPARSPAS